MKKFTLLCATAIMAGCYMPQQADFKPGQQPASITVISGSDKTVLNLGNKGANFNATIDFKDYTTKASAPGTPGKTAANISKVDVYLLQLASAPAAGSDPIASANVFASTAGLSKTAASGKVTLSFTNVPANSSGKKYFVGVVVKENTTVIGKAPGTAWSGTTFTDAPTLAVSSSGITVMADFSVDTISDLPISVSLIDAVGAGIGSAATVTDGTDALSGSPQGSISEP
jgi:hypothetical protein